MGRPGLPRLGNPAGERERVSLIELTPQKVRLARLAKKVNLLTAFDETKCASTSCGVVQVADVVDCPTPTQKAEADRLRASSGARARAEPPGVGAAARWPIPYGRPMRYPGNPLRASAPSLRLPHAPHARLN